MLSTSKIYAIINTETQENPLLYLDKLLEKNFPFIQLRAKNLKAKKVKELALEMIEIRDKKNSQSKIIINDSLEICKITGADGVHIGQSDSCPKRARKILGAQAIIGLSTHSEKQIRNAPNAALSYIAFGPIFDSKTKSGHAKTLGLEGLAKARAATSLPLVAIGGINLQNAESVLKAGADYLAMIRELEERLDDLGGKLG